MSKRKMLFLLSFAMVVVLILSACGQSAPAASPSDSQSVAQPQANAVSIENSSFQPAELKVKAGATVVWTNNDPMTHDLKSDLFTSPAMSKGQTFEFKFEKAGTYEYICGIHPSMTGKIIVE